MADDFNLVLELLRAMRSDIADIKETQALHGQRLGSIDRHLANLHLDSTEQRGDFDRLRARVERIERRLDLNNPQH